MARQKVVQREVLLWVLLAVGVFCVGGLVGYLTRSGSSADTKQAFTHSMRVTATAYNSLSGETDKTPSIAAWGDQLKPGMKVIAVSRDLLADGLDHNQPVKIEGLPGIYRVMDKMNKRYTRRIDIYMGTDRQAALNWGKREVEIQW